MSNDYREFLELLNYHKVKYVIVGAHAVTVHSRPRTTGDLDVFGSSNIPVCFIGKNQLIKNKIASGREQDMKDVKRLEKFKKGDKS